MKELYRKTGGARDYNVRQARQMGEHGIIF